MRKEGHGGPGDDVQTDGQESCKRERTKQRGRTIPDAAPTATECSLSEMKSTVRLRKKQQV